MLKVCQRHLISEALFGPIGHLLLGVVATGCRRLPCDAFRGIDQLPDDAGWRGAIDRNDLFLAGRTGAFNLGVGPLLETVGAHELVVLLACLEALHV